MYTSCNCRTKSDLSIYLIDFICSSSDEDNLHVCEAAADFDGADNGNSTELQLKKEIVCAICRALMLVNQMRGSLNDFEEIFVFAKDMFFHSNQSLTAYCPNNWTETEKLLTECGYKEPKEFTICLDQSNPCHWDVMILLLLLVDIVERVET